MGTGQPHSLLAGGDRRPGGDALGIQDRRRGTAARAFAIVLVEARRISRRLGEEKICGRYFLYDLLSPFFALLLGLLLLRKDERVWR